MLYQLNVVQPIRYSSNCTMVTMATASHLFVSTHACLSVSYLSVSHLSVSLQPSNSSSNLSSSILYAGPIDPAQWVGLRKADGKLLDYLRVT